MIEQRLYNKGQHARMYLRTFSVLLWSCYSVALCAENHGALTDYFKESWTTRDGLPHNTVNDIAQTRDGYLWFATWEGVARFNGRTFTVFGRGETTGLPDNGIFAVTPGCDDELVVAGSRGGVSIYNNQQWQALAPAPSLVRTVFCDHQNRLWLGTDSGAIMIDHHKQRQHFGSEQGLTDQNVYAITSTQDGRIWVGTMQGLFLIDEKGILPAQQHYPGLPSGPIFTLAINQDNQLYVGTENGAYVLTNSGFALLHPQLSDIAVSKLLITQQGETWLGTIGHGLYRLHGSQLEHLGPEHGLPNNKVTSLFKDAENSVWIGTNGGLYRLRDAPFATVTAEDGLADDFVRALLPHPDRSLWAGTSKGLSVILGDTLRPLTGEFSTKSILSLALAHDGGVWMGSYTDGVAKWFQGKEVMTLNRTNGLAANEVRALLEASDGSLWIGSARGLNRRLPNGRLITYGKEDGLNHTFIVALYEAPNGDVWVGSGTGVSVWHDNRFRSLDIAEFENAEFIFGFYAEPPGDYLWMATDRGLLRYHTDTGKMALLGRQQGLPFDKYFSIQKDREGYMWASSNRGIVRFSADEAHQTLDGKQPNLAIEIFGESDGMVSAQANGGSNPASAIDARGLLWFATAKGIATVDSSRLAQFSEYTLPVVIEQVMMDGASQNLTSALLVPASAVRLEFQFAGLGYVISERIQYRTQLEGLDESWVYHGTQPSISYTNLIPGRYRFHVSARYPNGEWNPQGDVFDFVVEPHLWQRPTFWLMITVCLILLVIGFVSWRTHALKISAQRLQDRVDKQTRELREKADSLQQANKEKSDLLSQLRDQAEGFERQARQDSLTGVGNRRAFDETIMQGIAQYKRYGSPFCLLLIDLDHFKRVNDTWSHSVGDSVLVDVARCISSHCRDTDSLSRWGGEEFALLLHNTERVAAITLAERLRESIAHLDLNNIAEGLQITISVGIAQIASDDTLESLMHRADQALYLAKDRGRNRVLSETDLP